ncbi:unnamed protein product, partial [marine sediment metagenome]
MPGNAVSVTIAISSGKVGVKVPVKVVGKVAVTA